MKKWLLALVGTLVITSGTARMQEPASHEHEHAQPPAVAAPQGDHKPMMNMAGMKASMEATDKKLDDLVARLNAATGNDRIDALVAVVNALVAERTAMHEHMNGMMKMHDK